MKKVQWKDYIFIEDLATARKEDIEHNKQLFIEKRKFRNFMEAETKTKEGYEDGEQS